MSRGALESLRVRHATHSETDVWIGEDEGQTALIVGGVVQSVTVGEGALGPGYWPLMVPEFTPSQCLILGMGGGTIASLIIRRYGAVPITGVEHDPAIIRLARSAFGMDIPTVDIVEGDAFEFAATSTRGSYDYVAVDLFEHGLIPAKIFGRPFLTHVKRLLTPGGMAAFNFFKTRRARQCVDRLGVVFPRVKLLESRENLVAQCRPR